MIAGLFDAAKKANPTTKVYGFLVGPDGIIENEATELDDDLVNKYRNLGGFTMIKTGRTKIDTEEKMAMSRETCQRLMLDAMVIVGGGVIGLLLAGTVVIETVFDWPGLGLYAYNAIILSDYQAILGVTLWAGIAYITVNLIVDITLTVIDPRKAEL